MNRKGICRYKIDLDPLVLRDYCKVGSVRVTFASASAPRDRPRSPSVGRITTARTGPKASFWPWPQGFERKLVAELMGIKEEPCAGDGAVAGEVALK